MAEEMRSARKILSNAAACGIGDVELFSVFCDGTAGNGTTCLRKLFTNLLVRERMVFIFVFDAL